MRTRQRLLWAEVRLCEVEGKCLEAPDTLDRPLWTLLCVRRAVSVLDQEVAQVARTERFGALGLMFGPTANVALPWAPQWTTHAKLLYQSSCHGQGLCLLGVDLTTHVALLAVGGFHVPPLFVAFGTRHVVTGVTYGIHGDTAADRTLHHIGERLV